MTVFLVAAIGIIIVGAASWIYPDSQYDLNAMIAKTAIATSVLGVVYCVSVLPFRLHLKMEEEIESFRRTDVIPRLLAYDMPQNTRHLPIEDVRLVIVNDNSDDIFNFEIQLETPRPLIVLPNSQNRVNTIQISHFLRKQPQSFVTDIITSNCAIPAVWKWKTSSGKTEEREGVITVEKASK